MASDDRKDKQPQGFPEPQLEAEICRQELLEAEAELRSKAAPIQQIRKECLQTVRKQGYTQYNPADPEGVVQRVHSFNERSKQVETLRARLMKFRMREEWERSRGLGQKLDLVRSWGPIWLRSRLVVRPRLAVAGWITRGLVRLVKRS